MEDDKEPQGAPSSPFISLRRFELSDIDDLMEWVTDERAARFMRWEACRSREEAVTFLRDTVLPHPWFKAICLRDDGGRSSSKAVGFIFAVFGEGVDRCRAKLSCNLARKYWGAGIAATAIRLAVSELFRERPHLERVEADTIVENRAPQRMLEKAGFQREGVLRRYYVIKGKVRDVVMYSSLRPSSKI